MSAIDKELNEIIRVKGLLENPGFIEYQTKVRETYDCVCLKIDKLISAPVLPENLSALNQAIAERNALGTLILIKIELEESVSPSDGAQETNPEEVKEKEE